MVIVPITTYRTANFPEKHLVTSDRPETDQIIDEAQGVTAETAPHAERRAAPRLSYDAYVALLLISPLGDRGQPMVLRTKDISFSGISVISRNMIYPGSTGAMQMVRSDGYTALVGVSVATSRYLGNMLHMTGMEFVPLPVGVTAEEFMDKHGRLMLMDPLLRENIDA